MKKGFTLTELLMALTIVGVLAVLTIPILMNNIHNRVFANQVKNMAATIEQLAQDELIAHRVRDTKDTDFGDGWKILSEKHFAIAKSCIPNRDEMTNCWKTEATGKDKVTYKTLSKKNISVPDGLVVILKNGVIMRYSTQSTNDKIAGCFTIDVNGNDKPNIAGRDLFTFCVSIKGHVVDTYYAQGMEKTLEEKIANCKSSNSSAAPSYCFGALADNGWKMDY